MRIMYCYIEPWVVFQNIYLMSDETTIAAKIGLNDIPSYLATSYNNKECDKIILHGSIKAVTEQCAEDVVTYGAANFGLNNINIEVVK